MMTKTHQLSEIWEKDFGKEYTLRNLEVYDQTLSLRTKSWQTVLSHMPDLRSVVEFGCNAGLNLEAIHAANPSIRLTGIEPNEFAREEATKRGKGRFEVLSGSTHKPPAGLKADLAFTCTVLIHVEPANLKAAMQGVFGASNKYVLAMEYYWPETKNLFYRGHGDALWKADFGGTWLREFPLKPLETGYFDARDGFDRVTWWLFEKK